MASRLNETERNSRADFVDHHYAEIKVKRRIVAGIGVIFVDFRVLSKTPPFLNSKFKSALLIFNLFMFIIFELIDSFGVFFKLADFFKI